MRNMLATIFISAALALSGAQEPAPSREWVRQYCATACVAQTAAAVAGTGESVRSNDVTRTTLTVGTNTFTVVVEDATVPALRATDCNAAAAAGGITNGMLFVWRDEATNYANGAIAIVPSRTNLVCGLYRSATEADAVYMRSTDGGEFAVWFTFLQPSVAETVAGGAR